MANELRLRSESQHCLLRTALLAGVGEDDIRTDGLVLREDPGSGHAACWQDLVLDDQDAATGCRRPLRLRSIPGWSA